MKRFAVAAGLMVAFCGVVLGQDGYWVGSTTSWADSANWQDGVKPGVGGIVNIIETYPVETLDLDEEGIVIGGIVIDGEPVRYIRGPELLSFVSGSQVTNVLDIKMGVLDLGTPLGGGESVIHKIGTGKILVNYKSPAEFGGKWLIEEGLLEIWSGTSLVAEPDSLVADALILDGGAIKNYDSSPVFPPNMGIYLGAGGGAFSVGWHSYYFMSFESPITGPGELILNRNNGRFILKNQGNDFEGGVRVGAGLPGWHPAYDAWLQLDNDGVLPYGEGKAGMVVDGEWHGVVDSGGFSNRVCRLEVSEGGVITNSVAGMGGLYADSLVMAGSIKGGARVVWCGGDFEVRSAMGASDGVIELWQGGVLELEEPQALGGATLWLDGGEIRLSGGVGEIDLSTNSGLLAVSSGGGALTVVGDGVLPPVVVAGGIWVESGGTLICNTDVVIDGSRDRVAIFDGDVEVPEGCRVILRGVVWLSELPEEWEVEPGCEVYVPEGRGDLIEGLQGAGCVVRVCRSNGGVAGAEIEIGSGESWWFDTYEYSGGYLSDGAGSVNEVASDIVLDGGTVGFEGDGVVEYSGVISGSGALVKSGDGRLVLEGGSSFSGTVTVGSGVVEVGDSGALGSSGNVVEIGGGGWLANMEGSEIVLQQDIVLDGGGFIVNGGSLRLGGEVVLDSSREINKQGSGELILNVASLSETRGLNLSGGAVVVEVSSGVTNSLLDVWGSGDLVKRGEGALELRLAATYSGKVVLEEGELIDLSMPASMPAMWLDASVGATLEFREGSSSELVRWRDVRDGGSGSEWPYAWLNELSPNLGGGGYKTAIPPVVIPGGLAGKPVVDFGVYRSGSWLEFGPVTGVRTIFWVVGSQSGGGLLIGGPDKSAARGGNSIDTDSGIVSSDAIFGMESWIAEEFRSGQVWTNGVAVNPNVTGLNGGYQLVSHITTGPVSINGLAKDMRLTLTGGHADGVKRSGGQRLAEVLIYDRVLSSEERQETENYLRGKWFGESLVGGWCKRLEVAGSGTVTTPDVNIRSGVSVMEGDGVLHKSGPGRLVVEDPDGFDGKVILDEGSLSVDGVMAELTREAAIENPVPDAAFWVDASVEGSFGKDESNRVYWRDCRWGDGGDYIVATQRWGHAPVLLQSAVGRLPVVDFGSLGGGVTEKGLQWSSDLPNVRTVFWVIGSQRSGGILLGGNDSSISDFNRGALTKGKDTPIYYEFTAAHVKNGVTRIDGNDVDGTATGLSGGYQVVALRTTGNVYAGQFAHDRYLVERSGGQRLGEVIVYTRALSNVEMAAVEAYLLNKWQRPGARSIPARLREVEVPAQGEGSTPVELGVASRTLTIESLVGSGNIAKVGGGALCLTSYGLYSGVLNMLGGSVLLGGFGAAVENPSFWVDASRLDTLEFDGESMAVSKWHDCRFNGMYAAKAFEPSQTIHGVTYPNLMPTLMVDELNGLPTVDFGEWMGNRFLSWSSALHDIRTVFWVIGSQEGGGQLLSYDRDTGTRHFFRGGSGPTTNNWDVVTKDAPIWAKNVNSPAWSVLNGQTRKNGVVVDGSATGLSGGYDLVSVRTTESTSASSFGNDRKREYRNATGGQRLAEVLVYDVALSDEEIRHVESYLQFKWGIELASGSDVEATGSSESEMSIQLSGGSLVELSEMGEHQIGVVGGSGVISGGRGLMVSGLDLITSDGEGERLTVAVPLSVGAGGEITLTGGGVSVVPVVAEAGVVFGGGGSVSVREARGLDGDSYDLIVAGEGALISGFDASQWGVVVDDPGRVAKLRLVDGRVKLVFAPSGTLFLIR